MNRIPERFVSFLAGLWMITALASCQSNIPTLPSVTSTAQATAAPSTTATRTWTPMPTQTFTAAPTQTSTVTVTASATITVTPAPSSTSTITPTETITVTPTKDYPEVTVKMQANCRYGPGTAYLYRWGLYPGDKADVRGHNWNGSWYWIHPYNLPERQNCWASKIVFEEQVDLSTVNFVNSLLPHTTFAGPPGNVRAERNGNQVTVKWDKVDLSDDKRRGYMIEAQICESGMFYPVTVRSDETEFTFRDDQDCEQESNGLLYTAEKHGYSDPVRIPWPD